MTSRVANRDVKMIIDHARAGCWTYIFKNFLFSFSGHFGILSSGAKTPHSFTRGSGPVRFATTTFMSFSHVLFGSYPFKIFNRVIGFITIFMMNQLRLIGIGQPAKCDKTVKEKMTADLHVAIWSHDRLNGFKLSKNFPASGNSIMSIKESIVDSIPRNADFHGVPLMSVVRE